LLPALGAREPSAGYLFYDCQTDDVRLVLTVLGEAERFGAVIANRLDVTGLLEHGGRAGGVQVLEISGPAVLAASADAAVPRVPGMKELLAAAKKPVELLELAALKVPPSSAVVTVTGRSRPERKARKGQLIDTTDPAAAAAELVTALREAGTL